MYICEDEMSQGASDNFGFEKEVYKNVAQYTRAPYENLSSHGTYLFFPKDD